MNLTALRSLEEENKKELEKSRENPTTKQEFLDQFKGLNLSLFRNSEIVKSRNLIGRPTSSALQILYHFLSDVPPNDQGKREEVYRCDASYSVNESVSVQMYLQYGRMQMAFTLSILYLC